MEEDEGYLSSLSKDLQSVYTSRKKELIKTIKAEFEKKLEFNKNSKKEGIESDRRHRDLINMCVFPFTDTGALAQTNYKYIRAAPLSELNIPNFDFLLFKNDNQRNIAIFGECKGSVSDPAAIVAETISRMKAVVDNLDTVKEKYLKLQKTSDLIIEYVIAVPSTYAIDVLNSVVKLKAKLIIWHAPLTGVAEISLAKPNKGVDALTRDMLHSDNVLNTALNHVTSNRKTFNYFPQGHTFSKLQSLLSAIKISRESQKVIMKDELKRNLAQDLFYAEEMVDTAVESLLSKGLEIGFLEVDQNTGTYLIKGRGYRADILEGVLLDKWMGKQLGADLEEDIKQGIERLKTEINAEAQKTKKLGDYPQQQA